MKKYRTTKQITMAQQTAVEWIVKELELEGYPYIIKQAKQMEKEQIMDAYGEGYVNAQNYEEIGREQFYDDTYGGKDL